MDLIERLKMEPLSDRERQVLRLLAEGLTNREIADKLFISYETVKWHNKQIYSKLGVNNRTQAVAKSREHNLLEDHIVPSAPIKARPKHNLPVQITSFVGREDEIAEVQQLIERVRLLTLTGPGGIGKTRLAVWAVKERIDSFRDGVFFVNLAPISQPELLGDTIMGALGLKEIAGQSNNVTLTKYLEDKEILLLLDNFEQIIEVAPQVGEWLLAAPDLKILVTSREPLRVYGEQEYPVPPLSLPDLANSKLTEGIANNEAVLLFEQRARAVKLDFELTSENARWVAEVCVRLDGLPLAIELAAARVKLFSPRVLLDQMGERFAILTGGPRDLPTRQQTLWNTIDWSYQLLAEGEKMLLARLSVFQGGRTIEAVRDVCAQDLPIDVLDGLESLLNKSLLRQVDGPEGEPRFIMLETIHAFARDRLEEMGETTVLRRRHAAYFTALCERSKEHIRAGPSQMRWLRRLEAEHGNLRTALEWSFWEGEVELGLRMVITLDDFWYRQGHYQEGEQWVKRALEHSDDAPMEIRAGVFDAAGLIAWYLYDRETGKRMHRKALMLYRDFGDQCQIGWALIKLGFHSIGQARGYEQAVAHCEEGVALLQEAGDLAGVAQGLNVLGELTRLQGDHRRAERVYNQALDIARQIGDRLREAMQLANLGFIAQSEGGTERALKLIRQALEVSLKIEHEPFVVYSLAALAGPLGDQGGLEAAARLIGAVEKLFNEGGFAPQPGDVPVFEGNKNAVREKMGPAEFEAAYARGREMSLADAVAFAMSLET